MQITIWDFAIDNKEITFIISIIHVLQRQKWPKSHYHSRRVSKTIVLYNVKHYEQLTEHQGHKQEVRGYAIE